MGGFFACRLANKGETTSPSPVTFLPLQLCENWCCRCWCRCRRCCGCCSCYFRCCFGVVGFVVFAVFGSKSGRLNWYFHLSWPALRRCHLSLKPRTFAMKRNPADRGDWNISSLTCDASGLTGNRAGCWQLTGRDGEGPVTGEFRINFRESEWTPWLPHDVGAGEKRGGRYRLVGSTASCFVLPRRRVASFS